MQCLILGGPCHGQLFAPPMGYVGPYVLLASAPTATSPARRHRYACMLHVRALPKRRFKQYVVFVHQDSTLYDWSDDQVNELLANNHLL